MTDNPLPPSTLAKMEQLPIKPAPINLSGTYIYLEPLNISTHTATLFQISNGCEFTVGNKTYPAYDANQKIWEYMSAGPFDSIESFQAYLYNAIATPDMLPFCVLDTQTQQPIGCTCLMTNTPQHLKIEIGGIWYSPIAQGTFANTEATYLLLEHAFSLGYRRVEWKCNALNIRSRRAAERIGFTFEGIQEAHYIIKGRNRDTAWFRILDYEWNDIKAKLQANLYHTP
jgi:RimJ/RimL family protein N-acetyltransferase